ncbi:TPA: hypothetical protein ACPD28_000511 [Pasteurella multocida]
MALTKDQILTHVLGINLFRARNNDIVRVVSYGADLPDDPIVVTRLTGEDRGYNYGITTEGNYYVGGSASAHDLVALITADDLQLLTAPKEQPAPNLDLKQCMENHTYLKTRGGEKALVVTHTPGYTYKFRGVIIDSDGYIGNYSWTEDGKLYDENHEHRCDIVGLWED